MSIETDVENKAKMLISLFFHNNHRQAKLFATTAVDEILNLDVWDWPHNAKYGKLFWEEVKEKIIKL